MKKKWSLAVIGLISTVVGVAVEAVFIASAHKKIDDLAARHKKETREVCEASYFYTIGYGGTQVRRGSRSELKHLLTDKDIYLLAFRCDLTESRLVADWQIEEGER